MSAGGVVIHEYGPDYGIDCVVELFDYVDEAKTIAETLGELFFVQLKSSSSVEYANRRVYPRLNVEKSRLNESKDEYFDIQVAKFQIEMSELLTVQSMGPAVPVLLVLIDVNTRKAFFVCLTDYIDKIIIPEDPSYSEKNSKVIYIPLANEILQTGINLVPLRAYGKRSKMYGAFGKFVYQMAEINRLFNLYPLSDEELNYGFEMIRTFTKVSLRQDIWTGHDFWEPISWSHFQLNDLQDNIEEGISPKDYVKFFKYSTLAIFHVSGQRSTGEAGFCLKNR